MADVFYKGDVSLLLKDKYVLYIGDSNVRAMYKDLIWIYKTNALIDVGILKRRLEESFLGDRLVERSALTRGRDFTEHRLFKDKNLKIEFLFVTRCYNKNLQKMFAEFKSGKSKAPDVIYMSSCLWDVSRWGPNGVKDYKANMVKLMKLVSSSLPASSLFIWGTALPTASVTSGGLIVKQIEFLQAALRIHVIEANKYMAALVASHGYDVLDGHHYLQYQITRRSADGIHFLPPAVRLLTNLFLTHLSLTWDVKLPERLKENVLPLEIQIKLSMDIPIKNVDTALKKIDALANHLSSSILPARTPSKKKKNKKRKRKSKIKTAESIDMPRPPVVAPGQEEAMDSWEERAPIIQPDRASNIQRERARDTPPFYRKGRKQPPRKSDYYTCATPPDFRLLSFNDFTANNNALPYNSRYTTRYNQDGDLTNHWSINLLEQLRKVREGALIYRNICDYYNDPYSMSYDQQRRSHSSRAQSPQIIRTVYNMPANNYSPYDRHQYNSNTYYNNTNRQFSQGHGPIRNRNRPARRYYNPYKRGNNYY